LQNFFETFLSQILKANFSGSKLVVDHF